MCLRHYHEVITELSVIVRKHTLREPVDEELNMTRQCVLTAQQANCTLDPIPSSMGQGEGGYSDPLPHSAETFLGVLHPALEPSAQDRPGAVGAGPKEATAMI